MSFFEKNLKKKLSSGARSFPLLPPLSPGRAGGGGGGVNQSCLTADMWFGNTSPQAGGNQSCLTVPLSVWSYDTCQVKKVNPLRQGQGRHPAPL